MQAARLDSSQLDRPTTSQNVFKIGISEMVLQQVKKLEHAYVVIDFLPACWPPKVRSLAYFGRSGRSKRASEVDSYNITIAVGLVWSGCEHFRLVLFQLILYYCFL